VPQPLDVALALDPADRALAVAHVLPDGRSSPLRAVEIPTPTNLEKNDAVDAP
jgi:hypothetical protein